MCHSLTHLTTPKVLSILDMLNSKTQLQLQPHRLTSSITIHLQSLIYSNKKRATLVSYYSIMGIISSHGIQIIPLPTSTPPPNINSTTQKQPTVSHPLGPNTNLACPLLFVAPWPLPLAPLPPRPAGGNTPLLVCTGACRSACRISRDRSSA